MRFTRFWPLLFILSACAVAPALRSFFVETGVIQYFLSPSSWTAKGSKARLDVTYRTGTDWPATVNISFFGKKELPRNVGFAALRGSGVECPLEDIEVFLVRPENKELRITSTADRETFVALLNAEPITLTAEIDGVIYVYTPEKKFLEVKNTFLTSIAFY